MKREFLEGLGLPEEQITTIMKEHGKSVTGLQNDLNTKVTEIGTLNKSLEKYKDINVEDFNKKITTLTENLNTVTSNYQNATNELNSYKNTEKVGSAGIAPQFRKFVSQEVTQLVSEEKDFETALNEYVEANPQYKEGNKQVISTSPSLRGSEPPKGDNDSINQAILRKAGK